MIKIHCDRCGEEIKDINYYTINIYKESTEPTYSVIDCSNISCGTPKINLLAQLNSKKMYCKECKDDIEYYIDNRETEEDKELRELSEFANMSD